MMCKNCLVTIPVVLQDGHFLQFVVCLHALHWPHLLDASIGSEESGVLVSIGFEPPLRARTGTVAKIRTGS